MLRAITLLAALSLFGPAASAGPAAAWLGADGKPNASARDALNLLAEAPADGLVAEDYRARELALQATALQHAAQADATQAQVFERSLDAALQRFGHDLHRGRVDPRSLGFRIEARGNEPVDFAAALYAAAARQQLPQAVAALRPGLAQYGLLRQALARYRMLASDTSLQALPAIAPARSLEPGGTYVGASQLQRRLVALGDQPAEAAPPGDQYGPALVDAVKRFQARHGLDADGIVGAATLAALNVPLDKRVRQLELALERLRWLPDLGRERFIGINIPMFRLFAWDPAAPADALVEMNVVVGRALNTQTPVLFDQMRYLVFRPYWNVPLSIARNEVLPGLARDPAYLQRHDMEIVRGGGDNAQPALAASAENLALLRQGVLRVRQRPGPRNSLGPVKFIFPNDDNVYLHGTPAMQLFGRARRDFSHGCVRVQEPLALAQWVLKDQPQWTRQRVEAAMAGAAPLRVDLAKPLPVILFYVTAMVMPSDQALHFATDIYGHDARLERALAQRRAGP